MSSIFGVDHACVSDMYVFGNNLVVTSAVAGTPLVCFDADTLERKWEYKGVGTGRSYAPREDISQVGCFSPPIYCTASKKIVCLEKKGLYGDDVFRYRLITHIISLENGFCIEKSGLDEPPTFSAINVIGERIFRYSPGSINMIQEVSFEGKVIREISFNDPLSNLCQFEINFFKGSFVGHANPRERGVVCISKFELDRFDTYAELSALEQVAFRISDVFIDRHYLIFCAYSKISQEPVQIYTADLNSGKSLKKYVITKHLDLGATTVPINAMARNADFVYFTKFNNLFAYGLAAQSIQILDRKIRMSGLYTLFTTDQFLIGATEAENSVNFWREIRIWGLKDHRLLQTIKENHLQQVLYTGKKLIGSHGEYLKAYDLLEAKT